MAKEFGVKEALAAGEFATTTEQKRTVLAVVKMLGLPITFKDQVAKQVGRLTRSTKKLSNKINNLEKQAKALEVTYDTEADEILGLEQTKDEWSV
jgi:hypothetical protein